jgi:hypothetical protein
MNLLSTLTAASASSVALALSDGTPVEFSKITSKDNIQVRVPTSHAELGDDPLRIFRRDGTHYRDETDLTLVATAADSSAAPATAAVPAAAPAPTASNDNATYTVDGVDFDNFDDAKEEAIAIFAENPTTNVEIIATVKKVVGVVGFQAAA